MKKEIGARTARPDDYWIGKGNLLLDVILYLFGGNHLFGEDVGTAPEKQMMLINTPNTMPSHR